MSSEPGPLQIRSYRNCFRLERRIHKIDRWRIPVPYGVPLAGIVYAAAVLLGMLAAAAIPGLGDLVRTLHPSLRFAVIPAFTAWALIRWTVDGRPIAAVAGSWLRWRTTPRRIAAFRAAAMPGEVRLGAIAVAPDEHTARCRRAVVEGRGRLVMRYPFKGVVRGGTLRVIQQPGPARWRGTQIRLRRGQRVVIG